MENKGMKKLIILIPLMAFCLQGCFIGLIAAGVGVAKGGNAKKIEARAKQQEAYGNYQVSMERLNLDREKANLPPRPIMTFDQWANGVNNPNGEETKIIQSSSTVTDKK